MHMELTQTNNSLMFHTFETKVVYMLGTWHISSWKTKKNDCNSLILKDIYLLKTENIIHKIIVHIKHIQQFLSWKSIMQSY